MAREDRYQRLSPWPKGGPAAWGAKCAECPLNGEKPVFGDGPMDTNLAIVGEAPLGLEADQNGPFLSRGGELLELVLAKVGTHRNGVWLDNAIACPPPGGDMKTFLRVAKKEFKLRGREWNNPVDCCRPRLFHALGIRQCALCHLYEKGPEKLRCRCASPVLAGGLKRKTPIEVVTLLGNNGLESLHGTAGITDKRGYPDWNGRPAERPIPGQGHNGPRLDPKRWMAEFVKPWTTTKPADEPAQSSEAPPTSKKKKASPASSTSSRAASASGSSTKGRRPASSSSRPKATGKKR